MTEQTTTATQSDAEAFVTHLRTIANIKAESRPKDNLHVWSSTEELLLSMVGDPVEVETLNLPDGMRRGQLKACFRNALMVSILGENLRYTEGYAQSGFFPVAHAWVTDIETGTIYDPTWINLDYEGPYLYLGLPFARTFMAALVDETGDPSVFESDYRRKNRTAKKGLLRNERGEVTAWGDPPPF